MSSVPTTSTRPPRTSPSWFWRDLELGDTGDDVRVVQRRLQATVTGEYGDDTAARVRGVQRRHGLPQTGAVDLDTANAIGEKESAGQLPSWWGSPEQDEIVMLIVGDDNAVRRLQSAEGLPTTGIVDEALAVILADRSA